MQGRYFCTEARREVKTFLKFLKIFGNGDVTHRRNKGMSTWKAFPRAFVEAAVPAATG
jgi:hypothetical protein